jgi:signal transduction histidine kinase/ligand-binding sensor domain-containing protein
MKKMVLLLVWAVMFCTANAQLQDFLFRHYSIENGLPPSHTLQITQDKKGFIWCESLKALTRYDGDKFHVYRHDDKDSFSFPFNKQYRIAKGSNDPLIIGNEKSIYYYDSKIDGFRQLVPPNAITPGLAIAMYNKNGKLWFGTADKKLHCFDIKTGKADVFGASEKAFTSLLIDSKEQVWVGTVDGLYRFHPSQNRYELYWRDSTHKMYGASMITDMLEDSSHDIWFSGYNSGICVLDKTTHGIRFFDFKPLHWRRSDFYSLVNLEARHINGRQYILVSTADGLAFLEKTSGNYTLLRHDPANPYSLPSDDINAALYDNTGTLWVSTASGLSKSERAIIPFKTVRLPILQKSTMKRLEDDPNTEINVVYQDHHYHTTWVGTDSLGLLQYDLASGKILKQIMVHGKDNSVRDIDKLYTTRTGHLLLGTHAGVFVYEPNTGQVRSLAAMNEGKDNFTTAEVTSEFIEDAAGNIWVGTRKGIVIYDAQFRFITSLQEEKSKAGTLKGQYVFSMYPKNDRQVWVSTHILNLYDMDSARFVERLSKNQGKYVIPTFVRNITRRANGDFYFVGDGRLTAFSPGADSFYIPAFSNLMASRDFAKLFDDKKGQLWFTTLSSGLVKIDPASNTMTQFTVRNGLTRNQLHLSNRSQPGDPLFIIFRDGFQYFNPDSIKADVVKAPLHITGMEIMTMPLKADFNLFKDSTLTVSYKENVITFSYSLLDYSFTEGISYQYKLEGFDNDWINAGNRRSTTYTNLDAGNYVFRVRARNHDNIAAGETALLFRVKPPFWKTLWFIALVALLVVVGLYRWYAWLQQKYQSEKILNAFTASLYGQSTIEDMSWDIASNCIEKLGFVDCVVYVLDDDKKVLVQKAARGPKNPSRREILHPIEIPLGQGIVGSVALSGVAEIVNNTSRDKRYLVDDAPRLSEISVPIVADGNVLGVIDSEHPQKNFYTKQHLYLLKAIAAVCSVRISKYIMEERLRTRVARDLHDDIGSTLSSININSNMALTHLTEDGIVKSQLEKISKHSGSMMESMSDIIWAISPANDSIDNLFLKMREFAAEILEPLGIQYSFQAEGDFASVRMDVKQRKDFYLLYKEAVNNAAKYSSCNHLSMLLKYEHHCLYLTVKDDGKGFNEQEVKMGNGLANMRERALSMGAKMRLRTLPGEGTTIFLDLPIT